MTTAPDLGPQNQAHPQLDPYWTAPDSRGWPTPPPPPQKRKRRRWPYLIASGALLIFIAITIGIAMQPGPVPSAIRPATVGTSQPPVMSSPVVPAPVRPINPHFGQTYTYSDGLIITVTPPAPFTPSASAAGLLPGNQTVAVNVSITNGTGQNYIPGLFNVVAQSGTAQASEVFDSAQNILGAPTGAILPGRTVAFTAVFSVMNPGDVVVQVTPGLSHVPVIFTD